MKGMMPRNVCRLSLVLLAMAWVTGGCRMAAPGAMTARPVEVSLPLWFTTPSSKTPYDVPVSLDLALPPHLQPLASRYGLPNWVVYGVVRSLGAREFLANGVTRVFSVTDEQGESRVVVDDLYYDVSAEPLNQILKALSDECARAPTERDRLDVLGSFVKRRHGGLILFSLDREPDRRENLLLTSGRSSDPVETFSKGKPDSFPSVGWKETGGYTVTTMVGAFRYGHAAQCFRQTEEEAIRDLAKGLMVQFSHMSRNWIEGGERTVADVREETLKEDITLKMRGVLVRRRMVDLERGLCLVEVCVPVNGVARQ